MKTSYCTLLDKLITINTSRGIKLGLENALALQKHLEYPDKKFASIHVAGTNGKGSVSTKIAKSFQHAGHRVGLYTSPHISCFRERIRVNGEMITEIAFKKHLQKLFTLIEEKNIPATFFELTTFLAFLHFAKEGVDVAVLETGLGGRLDATNVIIPCLSVITSIDFDHTEILGNTLEAITFEKAGIIKENVPILIGPNVPRECIENVAKQKKSLMIQVKSIFHSYEEENKQIAQAALNHLAGTFNISFQSIEKGLEAKQPCRFEVFQSDLPIILDVAHNPNGLKRLFQMLEHTYPKKKVRILFGLSKSKDIQNCLKAIAEQGSSFHIVEASNGRGFSAKELLRLLLEMEISPSRLSTHPSIEESVSRAKALAFKEKEILLVCGSFFIMGEVRRTLGVNEPLDSIDLNERPCPFDAP